MSGRRPSDAPAARARRDRIVAAARELLREREAAKVIVSDVAQRADVAPATVYNLVGTREHVLVAVLDEGIDAIRERIGAVDLDRPIDSTLEVIERAAEVLTSDPIAFRRAISAVSEAADYWMDTTIGSLLLERIEAVVEVFDGSIPAERLAEQIQISFRGVVISWSYGQLDDDRMATVGTELALHVLGTTARPDVAFDIKRRLIALAKEPS